MNKQKQVDGQKEEFKKHMLHLIDTYFDEQEKKGKKQLCEKQTYNERFRQKLQAKKQEEVFFLFLVCGILNNFEKLSS